MVDFVCAPGTRLEPVSPERVQTNVFILTYISRFEKGGFLHGAG